MRDATGLQVRDLAKHFGGVQAVKGIRFSVQAGECVALIGPNGAGKSTTFACIAGQHAASAGHIVWNGEPIHALRPAERLRRGIARTFQVAQTFDALSVLHNVQLLLPGAPRMNPLRALDAMPPAPALALLQRVGLQDAAHMVAGNLPYGARKRLELAMALAGLMPLAGAGMPGLLLLDEPAAGLAAPERASLMQLVKSLTRGSESAPALAVLYTEHNMDAVFGVADRVLVIMEGLLEASGTAAEVAANPRVRERYLGRSFGQVRGEAHA